MAFSICPSKVYTVPKSFTLPDFHSEPKKSGGQAEPSPIFHAHQSHKSRPMIMRAPIVRYLFSISYTILGLFRAKNKIRLAYILVVMGSCASDVFSQVMSLAK